MKIAIIPARGGSKRIKNKNILDFMGKPMISYPLAAAQGAALFDKIHVSTDSPDIKAVAESLGFSVDFMRPADLADDKTPIMPVLQSVLKTYQSRGLAFETICLLLPCAPLIESSDLLEAHRVFDQHNGKKPLMAVSPFPVPVQWAYRRADDGALSPLNPGAYAMRSQDLGKSYYDSGTFYFFSQKHILGESPVTDQDYASYPLSRVKSVDIDDEEDLDLAKALFLARGRTS